MSTKTEQELHVERELALFEKGQKKFRCRGGQQQNLPAVLNRIEMAATHAQRSAAQKMRRADTAKAIGNTSEAAELANQAAAQTAAADQLGALVDAVTEIAKEINATLGKSAAETQHVIAYLMNSGRRGEATEIDKHSRIQCGADLAPVIAALPRPCENAPYTCSKCGREGHASKTAVAEEVSAEASAE
jgi:hypothetical protein